MTKSLGPAYLRAQFKRQSYYRFNTVMAVGGAFLAAMVQYFIWRSVAHTSASSVEQISTYAIVATAYALLIPTTTVANRIGNQVLKGTISYQLLRPTSFFSLNLWTQLGTTLFLFLTTAVPLSIAYGWLFHVRLMLNSPVAVLSVLLSAALGYLIAYQMGFLVGLIAFQTVNIGGFISLYEGIMTFFGGTILPINIYPQILQHIVAVTPFYAIQYVPLRGLTTNGVRPLDLLIQAGWVLVLAPVIGWFFRINIQKIDVAGG
ncbi:ABC transporter permease [Levilactobacillus andaensis]|uniref:ABC transporter permease n=1 Tax=Levilactobacillus andaensis TaxID=2799570 RepID=UPI0019428875|nr:ABC-2 family transporter protein [Levilactobacillus andaensis]